MQLQSLHQVDHLRFLHLLWRAFLQQEQLQYPGLQRCQWSRPGQLQFHPADPPDRHELFFFLHPLRLLLADFQGRRVAECCLGYLRLQ